MFSGEITAGSLEQRVALACLGGVGQHSRWLVDDKDLRILVQDIQPARSLLGTRPIGVVDDLCANLNLQSRFETGLTIDVHLALPDNIQGSPA